MSDGPSVTEMGLDQESVAQPLNQNPENPPEDPRPRSEILLERLDTLVEEEPDKYTPETRSNVWQFIHQIKLQETISNKKLMWQKYFHNFDDYKLFHELNIEWHGLSTNEINDPGIEGGSAFYGAFKKFINGYGADAIKHNPMLEDKIKDERRRMKEKVFPSRKNDWSSFITIENWREYMIAQGWYGLGVEDVKRQENGGPFYQAFNTFIKSYRADEIRHDPTLKKEIEDERTAIRLELFSPKHHDWPSITSPEEWMDFMEKNGWGDLTLSEISGREGGTYVYSAFNNFIDSYLHEVLKIDPDDGEEYDVARKTLKQKIYPAEKKDWSTFDSFDSFKSYIMDNNLNGFSVAELLLLGEGSFCTKFNKFISEYRSDQYRAGAQDIRNEIEKERRKMRRELFPTPKSKYHYRFDNNEQVYFDSKSERTVALLLHEYGLLDSPEEGVNVHVRISDDTKMSFDFITDNGEIIEYHPVQRFEARVGLDETNVLQRRLSYVSKPELIGKPIYQIWEISHLYSIISSLSHNPNIGSESIPTKQEFTMAVRAAISKARDYDMEKEREEQIKEELKQAA